MTLAEWQARYSLDIHTHTNGGRWRYYDSHVWPINATWDLFHLSDYVVRAVTGGSIWLWSRW